MKISDNREQMNDIHNNMTAWEQVTISWWALMSIRKYNLWELYINGGMSGSQACKQVKKDL